MAAGLPGNDSTFHDAACCAVNKFPSENGPFSAERRSPRLLDFDVLKYASAQKPCAALLNEKIAHFQIGNQFVTNTEFERCTDEI
jgi:hypothetical protein